MTRILIYNTHNNDVKNTILNSNLFLYCLIKHDEYIGTG